MKTGPRPNRHEEFKVIILIKSQRHVAKHCFQKSYLMKNVGVSVRPWSHDELSRGAGETMEAPRGAIYTSSRINRGPRQAPGQAREQEIIRQEEKEASMKHKMTRGEKGKNCVWRKVDMRFKTAII